MYYYSLNEFLREKFGSKVYKISLNGGFTCPNRDGKIGTDGCIFCSKGGSGEFTPDSSLPIKEQIKKAKEKVQKKCKSEKYIAYFQAFTNTYGPIDKLKTLYYDAISDDEVVGLSIGTRPDCIDEDIISLLCEINKIKPVFIEFGFQTANDETAKYIRRGYSNETYVKWAKICRENKINVVTHIIVGLPNETKEDMLNTVRFVSKYTDGIKIQLLHILKGTDLYDEFRKGKIKTLKEEEYIDILCEIVEILPKNIVIHRLTGDGDKKILVSPLWSANKKAVLNNINKTFCKRNIIQGSKL